MGKYRILYPTVTEAHGIKGVAGDEVTIDDDLGKALIPTGAVEPVASPKRAAKDEDEPAPKRQTRTAKK